MTVVGDCLVFIAEKTGWYYIHRPCDWLNRFIGKYLLIIYLFVCAQGAQEFVIVSWRAHTRVYVSLSAMEYQCVCVGCGRMFDRSDNLQWHMDGCMDGDK